jgi:hypothetical protein
MLPVRRWVLVMGLLFLAGCVRLGFEASPPAPHDGSSAGDLGGDHPSPGDQGPVDQHPGDPSPGDPSPTGDHVVDADGGQGKLTLVTSATNTLAGNGQAVFATGTIAVLGISDKAQGIEVFDLTLPASPKSLGALYTSSGPAKLSSWGNDVLGVHIASGLAYLATYYGGLVVVDLSSKAPTFAGGLNLSSEAWAVQVAGSHAYVANYGGGLAVVDVSVPSKPSLAHQISLSGSTQDLHVVGTRLYTAAMSRFHVVDISVPAKPQVLGELDTTTSDSTGTIYEVWSDGSHAFLVSKKGKRLLVIDLSSPKAPKVAWTGPVGAGEYFCLDGRGSRLYVGTGSATGGSVRLYDIGKPTAPKLLDELVTSTEIYEVSAMPAGVTAAGYNGKLFVISSK